MYREKLQAVIAENRRRQEQARQLNIRAGSEVFPIMSREKLTEWLIQRLNGARRMMEVVDFGNLKLPELESEMVERVITENPDTITIEGVTLAIEYGEDSYGSCPRYQYCRTRVEEVVVRSIKADAVRLPSGRVVDIHCSGYSAKTFAELVGKLEKARIDRRWSERRSELGYSSWMSNPADVFPYLAKLLNSVEITRTDNGTGDPIFGFFSLYESSLYFKIKLVGSKEEAAQETRRALELLFKEAVSEALVIPKEEPWQTQSRGIRSNWLLTKLGQSLQTRFEVIVREYAEGLTSRNIEERIEAIKLACEAERFKIGGEYEAVKSFIEATEAEVESNINAVFDRGLVESEIEQIREAVHNAREHFDAVSYADAKKDCERANQIAGSLNKVSEARIQLREEAELACSEASEGLYECAHCLEVYESANNKEVEEASRLMGDISEDLRSGYYEDVIQKARNAKDWLKSVRTAIKERSRKPPTADALAALRAKFGKTRMDSL